MNTIKINNRDEDSLWTRAAVAHLDFGVPQAAQAADGLLELYRARRADMLAAEAVRPGPDPGQFDGKVYVGCGLWADAKYGSEAKP